MTNIYLPQNDPHPERREVALNEQRRLYQYNHNKLDGIALAESVPDKDKSVNKFDWTRDIISIVLRVLSNKSLQDINEKGLRPSSIWRLLLTMGLYRLMSDRAEAGFWLKLIRGILSIVQKLQRLFGFRPKSENIEADTEAGNIDQVENRLGSLATKLQEPNDHLAKTESIQSPAKMTPSPPSRTVASPSAPPSAKAQAYASIDDLLVDLSKASLTDYQAFFKIYDDLFQLIHLPCVSKHFHEDKSFAAQRVAGANPLVIEGIDRLPDHFPVSDEHFKAVMGDQDSLAEAGREGRLYLADYKVLDTVKTSAIPDAQKYLSAPLVLFAVPKDSEQGRSLIPVAIQCEQKPGPTNPIFTPPPICTPQSQKWSWLMAKTIVQIADGNYHELISHLGRTHLLTEAFVIATARQLAPNHPLTLLLLPHFEGTLFINSAALRGLVNEGGTVDKVLSGELSESLRLSAESVQGFPFSFNEAIIPKVFESRKVHNAEQLPDYPYRDDALLIWEAIHQWVTDYLALYYTSDEAVVQDTELQAWLAELISPTGGKIKDIGEFAAGEMAPAIRTRAYLSDAIAHIIFTASAQHAAVNFPQSTLMAYVPNMPLAGYRPAPTVATGGTAQEYLDLLPSLEQAEVQMNMTYPLGSLYYTRLGDYPAGHFTDDRVQLPLEQFQRTLEKAGITIDERNSKRSTFYNFLHPDKIPQSINI